MKNKILLAFSSIFIAILCVLSSTHNITFASTSNTVIFDYNIDRIKEYLPDKLTQGIHNESYNCESKYAEELIEINPTILNYYNYIWTVNGQEINLQNYPITKNTTFKAKWIPIEFTIYYNYVSGEDLDNMEGIKLTEKYSIEHRVRYYRPNRNGYAFEDWYDSESFSHIVMFTNPYDCSDKILYAKWIPLKYNINYHIENDNSGNPSLYTIESDNIILDNPIKDGHIFKGWFTDKEFKNKCEIITKGTYGDLDLYPLWELQKYNIDYIMPNGDKQTVVAEYGKKAPAPDNYNNIFQVPIYDVSRNNVTENKTINVIYVNIWYLYVIGIALVVGIILTIILVHKKKQEKLHKLRYIYHSNFK